MTSSAAAYQDSVELRNDRNFASSELTRAFRFPVHRVVVQENHCAWNKALKSRFESLTSLQIGWDGYAGRPVSFTRAAFAVAILNKLYVDELPVPSIVPGGDGTLQIEWHCNGFDIELDILEANNVIASRYNHATDEDHEIEVKSDFTEVSNWLSEMV